MGGEGERDIIGRGLLSPCNDHTRAHHRELATKRELKEEKNKKIVMIATTENCNDHNCNDCNDHNCNDHNCNGVMIVMITPVPSITENSSTTTENWPQKEK